MMSIMSISISYSREKKFWNDNNKSSGDKKWRVIQKKILWPHKVLFSLVVSHFYGNKIEKHLMPWKISDDTLITFDKFSYCLIKTQIVNTSCVFQKRRDNFDFLISLSDFVCQIVYFIFKFPSLISVKLQCQIKLLYISIIARKKK